MADRSLLRLPTDTHLVVGEDTLVVRHDGDVELEQSLGRRLVRLEAGGDATLRNFRATGTLRAGGKLSILTPADLDDAMGDIVEIGDVDFTARTVVATTRVIIGRASLNVDIISAPEVVVHPDATGRIRLLDCLHEVPATRVRGCLSVKEYEADHGDVASFLGRRGVNPVAPLTSAAVKASASSAPQEALEPPDEAATLHVVPPPAPEPEMAPEPEPVPAPPPRKARVPSLAELVDVAQTGSGLEPAEEPPTLDDADLEPLPPAEFPVPAATAPQVRHGAPSVPTDAPSVPTGAPTSPSAAPNVRAAAPSVPPSAPTVPVGASPPAQVFAAPAPLPVAVPPTVAALPSVEAEVDAIEDDATVPPPRRGPTRATRSLDRALERLQSAYPSAPPEPVNELMGLVRRGRIHLVSGRIDDLWVATLKHHLAERSAIPRSALLAFHALREARDRA